MYVYRWKLLWRQFMSWLMKCLFIVSVMTTHIHALASVLHESIRSQMLFSAPPTQRVRLKSTPISKNWTFGKDGQCLHSPHQQSQYLCVLHPTPLLNCPPNYPSTTPSYPWICSFILSSLWIHPYICQLSINQLIRFMNHSVCESIHTSINSSTNQLILFMNHPVC